MKKRKVKNKTESATLEKGKKKKTKSAKGGLSLTGDTRTALVIRGERLLLSAEERRAVVEQPNGQLQVLL